MREAAGTGLHAGAGINRPTLSVRAPVLCARMWPTGVSIHAPPQRSDRERQVVTFYATSLTNFRQDSTLPRKSLRRKGNPSSGYSFSPPVGPRHGSGQPGQIRDKSRTATSPTKAKSGYLLGGLYSARSGLIFSREPGWVLLSGLG